MSLKSPAFWTRRHCIALAAGTAVWGLVGTAPATAASASPPRTLLVLGDSLSAEYGLVRGTGWVALLEQRLASTPDLKDVRIVNASVSGETTSGGRSRLPALLDKHRPTHVIIELGANDALRGLPLDTTRVNLSAMAQAAQQAHAKTLLIGMQVPPNYGSAYTRDFAAVFQHVARQEKTALVPFLLAGVADASDARRLFQPDGLHPTAQAHPRILENVWPVAQPWLAASVRQR